MEKKDRLFTEREESPYIEKIIQIDRVNKVVKGGKRLAFRALVIVGDTKGNVGIGLGKSKEVPGAIRKGIEKAKKRLSKINIVGGTIPHQVIGQFGASKVLLKPAKPGTGVIAGGAIRILLEAVGCRNVVAKSIGSGSAINIARATLKGLESLKNLDYEVQLRGKLLPVRYVLDEEVESNKIVKTTELKPKRRPRRVNTENSKKEVLEKK